jgi:gas vesicle protein
MFEIFPTQKSGGTRMKSFLAGLGIGVGLGMLLAPMSGEETRNNLRERANDLADQAREAVNQGREAVGRNFENVTGRVQGVASKFGVNTGGFSSETATGTEGSRG